MLVSEFYSRTGFNGNVSCTLDDNEWTFGRLQDIVGEFGNCTIENVDEAVNELNMKGTCILKLRQ